MALGEALITGAGSLIGSLSNALFGQQQSKDLMQYQAQLNQQAIDRQNVYNSPVEQMKRLREAGLNPNLVYGNGVDGNQSSAASSGIANRNPQLDTGLVKAVETFFQRKQLDNDTRNSESSSQLALANAALAKSKNIQAMQQIALTDKTFNFQVDKAKADLDYTLQAMKESSKRVDKLESDISLNASKANEIQENIRLLQAKTATEQERPAEVRARAKELISKANLNTAQIGVAKSIIALNDAKIDQLMSLVTGIDLENGVKAIEFQLTEEMQRLGLDGFTKKDLMEVLKLLLHALTH